MLQVTIKDIKTNEVIYDEQVSMVIMQAAEKDGVRAIRHMTKDAGISDMLSCVQTAGKEVLRTRDILLKGLSQMIEGEADDE